VRYIIDTNDKKYVSHTKEDVTLKDSYNDDFWNAKYDKVTKTRNFRKIRDELIADHREKIAELQKEVDILARSGTFEQYINLLYKK
jgi:hypothetical protein